MALRRGLILALPLGAAAAILAHAFSFAAPLGDDAEKATCFDPEGAVGRIIPACTTLIESGRYRGGDLAGLYSTRANAYHGAGDIAQALADEDEAIRLCPTAANYQARAQLREEQGDRPQAIADYTRAIAAEPDWAPPYGYRAELRLAGGYADGAVADFSEAIRLGHPLTVDFQYIRRAVAYAAAGRPDEALRDLGHVLEANPENALAYEVRGEIHAARGNRDAALADFRTALRLEPGREGAREGLRQLGAAP